MVQNPVTPANSKGHVRALSLVSNASVTDTPVSNPHAKAEQQLVSALQQLQAIYNDACKTRTQTITIKKSTFEVIATAFNEAYEYIKQPCPVNTKPTGPSNTEICILDSLAEIRSTVVNLDAKYTNLEAKVNNTPKTYADLVKLSSVKESKIEQQIQRRKWREEVRQERQKYGVTLSLKDIDKPEKILSMPAKSIAERCQQAINRLFVNTSETPRVIGISKLAKSIRLQFETEDEATTVRKLDQTKKDVWDTAFEGLKLHIPMHGIVVHGIPIANLPLTMMDSPKLIQQLESENHMETDTIVKISPLRRRMKNRNSETVQLHHSIIVYMNDKHFANKCISNGFYVDYLHYAAKKFVPQYQLMQCFNCCDYGHRATSCKRQSRCGKCGEKHNTRECQSTTVQCFQCKGSHEAWHPKCPVRIAEKDRLEELMGNTSCLFN